MHKTLGSSVWRNISFFVCFFYWSNTLFFICISLYLICMFVYVNMEACYESVLLFTLSFHSTLSDTECHHEPKYLHESVTNSLAMVTNIISVRISRFLAIVPSQIWTLGNGILNSAVSWFSSSSSVLPCLLSSAGRRVHVPSPHLPLIYASSWWAPILCIVRFLKINVNHTLYSLLCQTVNLQYYRSMSTAYFK